MSAKGPTQAGLRWPKDRLVPRPRRVRDEHLAAVLRGEEFLLFDGAMGTQLQARGLAAGELPELLCLTNPAEIRDVHAAYVTAGVEVVTT
ncbi:MAG: homocysteine S-methyltransferase family protein, partial [Coriobacteriaceae bacterium]|nr:homocysteine S-methyltransferase family protein [Coriobacteriaceae bacterium]